MEPPAYTALEHESEIKELEKILGIVFSEEQKEKLDKFLDSFKKNEVKENYAESHEVYPNWDDDLE